MIFGLGNDIVEVARIEKAIKNENFVKRVYTEKEILELNQKGKNKILSYAGRFSAKEAISKAIGTGVRNFNIIDIEILNNKLGKPEVFFYGNLKELLKNKKIEISISHTKDYATAIAIIFDE